MTQLYDAIKSNALADAQAGDWPSVAATLNAPSVGVRNTELRTTRWLMQQFTTVVDQQTGATEADLVLGTLQQSTVPRVQAALQSMAADGIDLSDPQVQQMIPALGAAAGWSQDLIDRLLVAGFEQRSPAQIAGFGEVTAQQCADHWAAGQAIEAGTVTYDKRRVLLSLNSRPGSQNLSLIVTPIGDVGSVEIEGQRSTVVVQGSKATGAEKTLLNAVEAAVAAYLGA